MPKIPIYERQIARSTEGPESYALPGERSSPMRIPSENAKYQGMQEFGERVTRIGVRLREADKVEQFSNALVKSNEGMSRILTGIQEDKGLMEAEPEEYENRYREHAAELKSTISGGIRDVQTRSKFSAVFDEKTVDGEVKMRALGRDRMISRGRASTDAQLDSLVNSFVRSGDAAALAEGGSIIAAKRAAGYFKAEEAEQLGQRFARSATVGYWERRIQDAPAFAYEMLKNNPESFQGLPEPDKTRLMASAQHAAESYQKDALSSRVYQQLYAANGENFERTLSDINNPAKWPALGLEGPQGYDVAKEIDSRFRTLLSERERNETIAEKNLTEKRKASTSNALVDFYSGKPMDLTKLDAQARAGLIDQEVYKHIRKGDAKGTTENDPFVVGPIMSDLEYGKDVTRALQDAMLNGKIKNDTYVSTMKQQADRDYKEGLSIVNKVMQPSDMDFNVDKRIAWGESVELYSLYVREGYAPRVSSSMVLDRYKKAGRRTLQGLPRPKYLQGEVEDASAVDAAIADTTERFKRAEIRPDEYRFEMNNLEAIRRKLIENGSLNSLKIDDKEVQKQIEASKKAAR